MRVCDDLRTTDQNGMGDAFVDDDLRGTQHALVLALGEDDALVRALGGVEHRLHAGAGMIDEAAPAAAR